MRYCKARTFLAWPGFENGEGSEPLQLQAIGTAYWIIWGSEHLIFSESISGLQTNFKIYLPDACRRNSLMRKRASDSGQLPCNICNGSKLEERKNYRDKELRKFRTRIPD
jgi:hypothetical protein